MGNALFGHGIGQQLNAGDLPWQRRTRLGAQRDAGRQACGQPGRAPLIHAQTHPQAGGVHQAQHRLARHHGAAGFGVACGDHAIGRGQQAHVTALLGQCGTLGPQALLVLAGTGQIGLCSLLASSGRGQLLHFGFQRAGANEVLPRQVLVALVVGHRQGAPGRGIGHLRLRRGLGTARAGQ